jgi:hypothetical protein
MAVLNSMQVEEGVAVLGVSARAVVVAEAGERLGLAREGADAGPRGAVGAWVALGERRGRPRTANGSEPEAVLDRGRTSEAHGLRVVVAVMRGDGGQGGARMMG